MEREDRNNEYVVKRGPAGLFENGIEYKCEKNGREIKREANDKVRTDTGGIQKEPSGGASKEFGNNGSVTVEASLILPLVIIVSMAFISFFGIMRMQLRLQSALEDAAGELSMASYVQEYLSIEDAETGSVLKDLVLRLAEKLVVTGIESEYARILVIDSAGREYLDQSCIKGGCDGIDIYLSVVSDEAGLIDLRASYECSFPLAPGNTAGISFTQRAVRKKWTGLGEGQKKQEAQGEDDGPGQEESPAGGGEESEDEDEDKVYITKDGTVYHIFCDCRSLKVMVKNAAFSAMGEKRNDNKEKYRPCERCIRGDANAIVFYTPEGDRYHNSRECGSLNRYIRKVTKKEAGDKPLCKFCAARQQKIAEELKAA